jgi:hypothetical protein
MQVVRCRAVRPFTLAVKAPRMAMYYHSRLLVKAVEAEVRGAWAPRSCLASLLGQPWAQARWRG